jgi:hypothetical protein
MAAKTSTTTGISVATLHDAGFTSGEIARLKRMRASYDPFREMCESDHEYQRLSFLKWRYQHGEVNG